MDFVVNYQACFFLFFFLNVLFLFSAPEFWFFSEVLNRSGICHLATTVQWLSMNGVGVDRLADRMLGVSSSGVSKFAVGEPELRDECRYCSIPQFLSGKKDSD